LIAGRPDVTARITIASGIGGADPLADAAPASSVAASVEADVATGGLLHAAMTMHPAARRTQAMLRFMA